MNIFRCPEVLMLCNALLARCQVEIVRGSRLQRIYFLVPKVCQTHVVLGTFLGHFLKPIPWLFMLKLQFFVSNMFYISIYCKPWRAVFSGLVWGRVFPAVRPFGSWKTTVWSTNGPRLKGRPGLADGSVDSLAVLTVWLQIGTCWDSTYQKTTENQLP